MVKCQAMLGCLAALLFVSRCSSENLLEAPIAKIDRKTFKEHGSSRIDNYYWLNQREDPKVIAYLEAENAYAEAATAHTKDLQESLVKEFTERIKQTDESVPYFQNGYFYYSRTVEVKDYSIQGRKKTSLDAPEEILLDGNELAEGHEYFALGRVRVSPDNRLLAFGEDTAGRRYYTISFKNLETGELLADRIPDTAGGIEWAADNRTVFYVNKESGTLREYQVVRHVLGTDVASDVVVFEETDSEYSCSLRKTKSQKYLLISSNQTLSNEVRFLDADEPAGAFRVLEPRRHNHEYFVDHFVDHFYIATNHQAKNFRLMKTPVMRTGIENWEEVIAHRDDTLLEDFEIFSDHLVVEERREGLTQLWVMPWSGSGEHYVEFDEPTYVAYPADNCEFDSETLRFGYESPATPDSVYDYDMATKERKLLKQDEVLGGFDPGNYAVERLSAVARDREEVPVSVVYRKNTRKAGGNPLLVYGYGSYGISSDAGFDPFRISLLDRGFVFAIAHVRGGEELGRRWYEDGKLLKKKNTFQDFIDCTEFLVEKGYGDSEKVFAYGRSAGGLLMGAVMNMRPDLWTGLVATVPFVDVVTTMMDETIPLTPSEWDEWGNPKEKEFYDYMLSYSPYDQVEAKDYPHLLVTTSLNDSQVQYFEPVKWVARLRALKTNDKRLIFKTEMHGSHGGVSGRQGRYAQTAYRYAFLLDLAKVSDR